MKKKINSATDKTNFRKLAETKYAARKKRTDKNISPELSEVLRELDVREIELEMQDEELRTKELKLDELRTKYFDLYNLAPIGYLTLNGNGKITEANLESANLFSLNIKQLVKLPITRLIMDDDQDIYYLQNEKLIESKTKQQFDLRMKQKDGGIFRAHIVAGISVNADESLIVYLYITDITERKLAEETLRESESKFRLLFENMEEGFSLNEIITDVNNQPVDFTFLEANNAYEHHTGMKPKDIIGKTMLEIMPDSDKHQIERYGHVALTGEPMKFEYFSKTFNRHLHVSSFSPQPGRFASIFEDITKRKKTEEIILKSLKEKEILLKEIHHRVKNNFQRIISLISLQSELIEDEKTPGIFEGLQNRLRSMSLIHELMYSSEDFEGVDVKDYIERLSEHLLRTYALSSRVRLNMDIESLNIDMDSIIPCGLIINEIVTNSLKYAFPGNMEGNINISFKKKENEYNLVVSDDGIGLKDKIDFENLNSLGLHLVELLTRQLRGKLEVDQSLKGLQFSIKFKAKGYNG